MGRRDKPEGRPKKTWIAGNKKAMNNVCRVAEYVDRGWW